MSDAIESSGDAEPTAIAYIASDVHRVTAADFRRFGGTCTMYDFDTDEYCRREQAHDGDHEFPAGDDQP